MASLTKDKNDSTLLISKVSEFKYGNLIKKGGKFHKVTFIDEISKKKLVEKINIVYSKEEKEIYKDIEINNCYNQNFYRNNFNDKADVNCKACNIF